MTDEFGLLNDKEQAFVDAYTEKIRREERARILKAIEDAPPAMDFFGPYISKEKLLEFINADTETTWSESAVELKGEWPE